VDSHDGTNQIQHSHWYKGASHEWGSLILTICANVSLLQSKPAIPGTRLSRLSPIRLWLRNLWRNNRIVLGQSKAGGFELTASFAAAANQEWGDINLVVAAEPGPAQTATEAEFFLHDTCRRPRVTVPFSQERAQLQLHVFGGFTVGVWIASHQVQLELDLAELPDAPQIVKEW
jgi:hypothetical protein